MVHILLVEDNPADTRLVQVLLTGEAPDEFRVETAASLAEARRKLAEAPYQGVLLDLNLPDATDLEAVRALAEETSQLPLIVLSGSRDDRLGLEAVRCGAQEFLVKGQIDGPLLARTIRHAIERTRSNREMTHLAHHDGLTDLPNRRLLLDRLDMAIARSRRAGRMLGVLFLDLDGFKAINDGLGHEAGDRFLQAVAQRLQSVTRESDTVARWGGDEFVVLAPEIVRIEDLTNLIEKLMRVLDEPFASFGSGIKTSASFGISLYPGDGDDPATLLRNADMAMYRAKEEGSTFRFYSSVLNLQATRRRALSQGLGRALAKGEFSLRFQPVVPLSRKAESGLEVLLRWNHPVWGQVPPVDFLPLAEESGLIVAIGEWVIDEACRIGAALRSEAPPRLTINMSIRQLLHGNLLKTVERALGAAGLAADRLELDVTEDGVLRHDGAVEPVLHKLTERGIRLAIDHYGSGHSSLGRLGAVQLSRLKIDPVFVQRVDQDEESRNIVRAIIALGHALGLEVVGEGVETAGQLAFLKAAHCDLVQGFYFGLPLTAEEARSFLESSPAPPPIRRMPRV